MAKSTRKRIRSHVNSAAVCMDIAASHLKFVSDYAQGRSEFIDKTIPELVSMLEGCKQLLEHFRSEL
jgi:hypothetical protein